MRSFNTRIWLEGILKLFLETRCVSEGRCFPCIRSLADASGYVLGPLLVLLPILLMTTGCQTMNLASPSRLFEEEPEFVTPTKVIPVWSDTVLHQAGKKGQRGCGGRVMFYAGDGKRAVRVDGSLVVYAWDDSRDKSQRKPDRKYVFPVDDFQKHFSQSSIGESYSFWIPWDETGGNQTELTLVARFVGRNGAEITSTPAKVILPGEIVERASKKETRLVRGQPDEQHEEDESNKIRQVSFEQTQSGPRKKADKIKPSLTAAEIPLTDGFLKRNMSNRAASYSAEELFEESADARAVPDNAHKPVDKQSQASQADGRSGESETSTESVREQAATTSPPEDRSLRFRHRVQTTRAAQRSVGRALSQRYQPESRRAPWERN